MIKTRKTFYEDSQRWLIGYNLKNKHRQLILNKLNISSGIQVVFEELNEKIF